ncbi:diacylglycerol/lipid kinase family protein [Streptomyces dubilierae]|uniref:Diacylglycerol kinase family protein n=1 Tax=Streptomyces dubilierae TaxID=3075533 RepID=A0ABU2PAA6_9ACTN|nr:diacylglycerol kinase family protein [Streptomyces sp. DSM 41921]MDT0387959.1 diacylglycerol kinase family protein [Streptomyces sp. DSM 41921]
MTTPDLDLTVTKPGRHPLFDRALALDARLFRAVAARRGRGARPAPPGPGGGADPGAVWLAAAAALAASRTPRARRAATRGLASTALSSLAVRALGSRAVRRPRPVLAPFPLLRRLRPVTSSVPSGRAARAAAFAAGVALESPAWGAVTAPVAGSVALARVRTGAHFPSEILAGAAVGVGAAFALRGLVPTRGQTTPPARPRAEVPALLEGDGLVLVANTSSGTAERARALRDALPRAEVVECAPDDVCAELEKAAARARVLGVCGGDGTVNTAARVALRFGVPLAVLPGGTLNHFAYDLGVEDVRDLARALRQGDAVRVDVGRYSCGDRHGVFLNTCSVGVYPELVRERERWSHRIGGWPAGVLAVLRVLRADRHPLEAEFRGRRRPLWLLFAGNGTYHRMGLAPGRRVDLADGQLDVRVVHGGRRPAVRLLAAALAGPLTRSPVHAAVQVKRLRLDHVAPGTLLAYDGEVTEVEGRVTLEKLPGALTVYRPITGY